MEREEQWVQCCLCPITVSEFRHQIVHFCVEVVGDIPRMQVAECDTTPGHLALEHLSTWPGVQKGSTGDSAGIINKNCFPRVLGFTLCHFSLRSKFKNFLKLKVVKETDSPMRGGRGGCRREDEFMKSSRPELCFSKPQNLAIRTSICPPRHTGTWRLVLTNCIVEMCPSSWPDLC